MVGSIVVVGVLTCCALLHSMCDLKATQVTVQYSLIGNLCFMSSKWAKNICFTKGEDTVDHNTVTRWLKKFGSDYRNLNNQARSGRAKTVDSETPSYRGQSKSRIQRVSGKLDDSQSSMVLKQKKIFFFKAHFLIATSGDFGHNSRVCLSLSQTSPIGHQNNKKKIKQFSSHSQARLVIFVAKQSPFFLVTHLIS